MPRRHRGTEISLNSPSLSGGSALCGFGLFNEGFLADDNDNAGIGDVETAAVGFEVIPDFGALGKADVAINDGATDPRVTADINVVIDDGVSHFAIAVDADVVANHGFLNATA